MKSGARAHAWIGPGLFALTLAIWWPATRNGFVNFDDNFYVTDNARVLAGLTWEGLRWAFDPSHPGVAFYWQPLTWLSLMADRTVFGAGPFGFHLVNVVLHALNAALVFGVLRALTGFTWRSALVAAFFAAHPLNVESVAWIVERKTVLSAFFGLLALAAYAGHARRPNIVRYLASLGLFTCSLMAKPMLVTLPFLLLMLDVWPLARLVPADRRSPERPGSAVARRPAHVLTEKLPFLLATAASLAMVHLSRGGIVEPSVDRGLLLRASNAVVSDWHYVAKALWPADLALFYPYPAAVPPGKALLAAAALALTTGALAARWRRSPGTLVGWLWFLGTLVPVLGLVQVGLWPAMADRFAYFPLIGLGLALVWGAGDALGPSPRPARIAGMALLAWLALAAVVTRRQIAVWGDSVALLEHAVAAAPDEAPLRTNLAASYVEAGRIDRAIAEYRAVLGIHPRHTVAYVGLAKAHSALGDSAKARETLERLSMARPGPTAHVELGNLELSEGRLDAAEREYAAALALDPGHAGAHFNLGEVLRRQGRIDAARPELESAVRLDPSLRVAHLALGSLEREAGNGGAALASFEKALRLGGDDPLLLIELGVLHGEQGRLDRATAVLEKAVRLAPGSAAAHDNLGTAYLLSGALNRALEHYEAAARLSPGSADTLYNLSLAYRRAGRPAEAEAALRRAEAQRGGASEGDSPSVLSEP